MVLEDSPSLKGFVAGEIEKRYPTACKRAAKETQLPIDMFPMDCPFTVTEILDLDFYP